MTGLAVVDTETGEYIPAGDAVQAGRDAWDRIKINDRMMRDDWAVLGRALKVGQSATNGSRKLFGQWCQREGFGEIDARLRSDAIWLADNVSIFGNPENNIGNNNPTDVRKAVRAVEKQRQLADAKERFKAKDGGIENAPIIRRMDALDFLRSIQDESVDLLLTDPPYATDVDDIYGFARAWVPLALSKIKQTGRGYICCGAYPDELHAYLTVLLDQERFTVDAPLIWTYRNTLGQTPKRKYNLNYQVILHVYTDDSPDLDTSITNEMFSVQDINAPDGRIGDRLHTWQKPDELAERFVRHASLPGDFVIDPFACTGTFLLAASRLGRYAAGSDINEENIAIGVSRGCVMG